MRPCASCRTCRATLLSKQARILPQSHLLALAGRKPLPVVGVQDQLPPVLQAARHRCSPTMQTVLLWMQQFPLAAFVAPSYGLMGGMLCANQGSSAPHRRIGRPARIVATAVRCQLPWRGFYEGSGWSWWIGVLDTQRLHDLRYLRDVSVRNGGFAIACWFPDGSTCKFRVTLVVCINGHALREYLLTVSCLIMFVPCYAIVTLIAPNVHDLCWDSTMTLVNSVGTPKWNKQPVGWWYLAIWTCNSQIKKMDNMIPYV